MPGSSPTRGPSVTRYELELMRGVKLNKLTNLAGTSPCLWVPPASVSPPLPAATAWWAWRCPTSWSRLCPFGRSLTPGSSTHVSKVAFAVGKDISGKNVVGNIAKAPYADCRYHRFR